MILNYLIKFTVSGVSWEPTIDNYYYNNHFIEWQAVLPWIIRNFYWVDYAIKHLNDSYPNFVVQINKEVWIYKTNIIVRFPVYLQTWWTILRVHDYCIVKFLILGFLNLAISVALPSCRVTRHSYLSWWYFLSQRYTFFF